MNKETINYIILICISVGLAIGHLYIYNSNPIKDYSVTVSDNDLIQIQGRIIQQYTPYTGELQYCKNMNFNIEEVKNVDIKLGSQVILEGSYYENWLNAQSVYYILE